MTTLHFWVSIDPCNNEIWEHVWADGLHWLAGLSEFECWFWTMVICSTPISDWKLWLLSKHPILYRVMYLGHRYANWWHRLSLECWRSLEEWCSWAVPARRVLVRDRSGEDPPMFKLDGKQRKGRKKSGVEREGESTLGVPRESLFLDSRQGLFFGRRKVLGALDKKWQRGRFCPVRCLRIMSRA